MLNYSICMALNDVCGPEKATEVFKTVGKYLFAELARKVIEDLSSYKDKPVQLIKSIADYLEKSGYFEKLTVTKLSDTEFIIEMFKPAIAESVIRIREAGASPPHFLTYTCWAALEDVCGMKADITHLTVEKDYAKEKWILKKIEGRGHG